LQLDVRTIYLMYAVLYLMLHGIIWFSLARYQNRLVMRWSLAGITSAAGIALLGSVGVLPEWFVASFGQVLMAAGNFGRQYVLRSIDGDPSMRWVWRQGLFHLSYLVFNGALFLSGASHAQMMLVFFAFYSVTCLDFYFAGQAIARRRTTAGARTLQFGGLVFTVSLGVKALSLLMGWGSQGLYDPGWDQVALFAAQILAISLLNFGFMQIFVDQFQQERVWAEQQSETLAQALGEREDFLRQLTLSSKTAGMGALVSALAHEINQPLTSIALRSELIEHQIARHSAQQEVHALCSQIRQDSYRAADMISALRSLFGMRRSHFVDMNFSRLVQELTDIVSYRAQRDRIALVCDVSEHLPVRADPTQLQQVVLNLLNNALAALEVSRPVRPQIELRASLAGVWVEMRVGDNGCGIDPVVASDVFALFKSARAKDMGVGLWLSQAVVQSHGGTLSFESTPGAGTQFLLRLPALQNAES